MLPLVAKALIKGSSIGGEQRLEIASALSLYGYPDKAKEYLNSSADRQYWVEADLLAAEALNGDDKLRDDTIKILLIISKIPNIATTSKAISLYNIARIYAYSGSTNDKASEYLSLSRELDKSMVDDRLPRDPVFLRDQESNNQLHTDAPVAAPVS